MKLKDHSVRMGGVQPEIIGTWPIVEPIVNAAGIPFVITSIGDGKHKPGSLHGKGMAYDIRCKQLPREAQAKLRDQIAAALGPEYDVVLERDPDHIHCEFDPDPARST